MQEPDQELDPNQATQGEHEASFATALRLWIVAAVYSTYLVIYFVTGSVPYDREYFYWHEGVLLALVIVVLCRAAARAKGGDRLFLLGSAVAVIMLLLGEVSHGRDIGLWHGDDGDVLILSNVAYTGFLFTWVATWTLMATIQVQRQKPGTSSIAVFTVLMIGLVLLFFNFYSQLYAQHLGNAEGRLNVAIAILELAALVVGIAVTLLGACYPVVMMFVGIALAAASDMLYSVGNEVVIANPLWMLGLCLLLAGALVLRPVIGNGSLMREGNRSVLSTLLLTLSLGAVLVSAVVGQEIQFQGTSGSAHGTLFFVLFVIGLVIVMVALTDLFDRAITRTSEHVACWLNQRLNGPDWRTAPTQMVWVLKVTGLGMVLDRLQDAATALRRDVIFLGPERLNPPPQEPAPNAKPTCFIVMPFGQPESGLVHQVLRDACLRAGFQPVRGDDLFTPSDILDDIWRSITSAQCVIADITGRNPNVMYELGIAHTLAKPVLILSRYAADIPIDLATRRVILYGTGTDGKDPDWAEVLAQQVGPAIEGLRASGV
ncbi:hypothetical protein W03_02880 [Nitrosomonas sp. PY1]|uniref:hypothetical protein n=1 Tax=Nitrosomonas sp. PY1 TaxID=1803906 RepID=UPI001FC82C25|nr:hypothetical protein [Nitrosomonas sp. PY1]GKS68284.1 hypothetical protein W03_02880 [Nitrosomonas sp. PY1]